MAEYFVGPVMDKLIDACFEYLKDQVGGKTKVENDLKMLRFIHPQIKAVVSTYNQVEIEDSSLNKWYWQLRDAIDEADNVIDEFKYWKLEKQVIKENKGKRKAEVSLWNIYENFSRALRIGKCTPKSDPNLKRLEEVVQKLHQISAQVTTFLHLLNSAKKEEQYQLLELNKKRETGSIIKNVLLGRSNEMQFIRQWLRNSYEMQNCAQINNILYKNLSVLSVVGLGGMGKTTLLQHLYNEVETTLFDVKMWVCVSINFDAKTVVQNMLESLKNKKLDLDTLESLQKSLQFEVTSKRFLLVLDDIWEEDDAKWENVLAPLQQGSLGSKILITTRLDLVARKFANLIKKRNQTLALKGLEENECLQLFNSHAFAGVENPDDEFKSIASRMVEKFFGCPLAAKVIGGILNSYIDKSYWIKVLNTTIGKVGKDQNHLLPILKLSYIYLPNFLQNCFSFCSIFPQDHVFDKDDLVRMWISLGFIESSTIQDETLEDKGRRYFNILVQKSFFDEFRNDSGIIYYKMHDLLHELAQFVAAHECLRIVGDKVFPIPLTIRHLSINGISSLEPAIEKMETFKNLRSLFLFSSEDAAFGENVITEILKASKNIRLLAIYSNGFKHIIYEMPEEIGCLIHLRYLKIKCIHDFELPRSISNLHHLQLIVLKALPDLRFGWKELMPNENCQLVLDNLTIKDFSAENLIMEPLRRISSIHYLVFAFNDKLVSFPYEAKQWVLQHNSSLYELTFDNLQSLESLPSSLECLSSLNILNVFDVPQLNLLPNSPSSLVSLNLLRLKSLQCLPSSLSNISSLRDIHLKNLENLDCLPSFLATRLTQLTIIEVPRLLELPNLPPSIESLDFENLKSLKCLPSSFSTFFSLTYLKLKSIPLLKSLPNLPFHLKILDIEDLESLECLPSLSSTVSSLTNLKLRRIPLLKSLPSLPSTLKTLYLVDLESLECHLSSFSTIFSLKDLKLENISLLESLPNLPSSLESLYLFNLKSLQSLPSLYAISSLDSLQLIKLPLLNSLPNLPSNLKILCISGIHGLLELPDLPASLKKLDIWDCQLQFMERYPSFF